MEHGHSLAGDARRRVGPHLHPGVELQISLRSRRAEPAPANPHTPQEWTPLREQPPRLLQRPGGTPQSTAGKQLSQIPQSDYHPVLLPQGIDHRDKRAPHRLGVRPVHQIRTQIGRQVAHGHVVPEGRYKPLVGAPCPVPLVSGPPSEPDRYSKPLAVPPPRASAAARSR